MRIIIVGGGPAGLATAHCLLRAGIDDIVILERRDDPYDTRGACIGLWPPTLRIMDQLNLVGELEKLGTTPHKNWNIKPNGHVFSESALFDTVQANLGYSPLLIARSDLVKVLYDSLPQKEARVIPGKKVIGIEESDSGVNVSCVDGSVFSGDMVVGCDGVHSVVRKLAIEAQHGGSDTARKPVSEFRCMFGTGPLLDGMPPDAMTELHDDGLTFQVISSHDGVFWLFYMLKEKSEPKCHRYTAEEMEALAQKHAEHVVSIGNKVTFADLWTTKSAAHLYDLEEACAERWHEGRAVIVGDSALTVTPNLALGGNSAIESAAALVNQLHALLKSGGGAAPTKAALEKAFARYQAVRRRRVQITAALTAFYTRQAAWATRFGYLVNRFIWPLVGDRVADWVVSPFFRAGQSLTFAGAKTHPGGKMTWKYEGGKDVPGEGGDASPIVVEIRNDKNST